MQIQLSDHFTYRKLFRYVLPSILMMLFTSTYSIVDGFFVSNFVGKTAFAAVNLIMPLVLGVSSVGFMLGELAARPVVALFTSYDVALMEMTVFAARICTLSFVFAAVNIWGSGFFTALNNGLVSALISFLRTLVFQVTTILLLPLLFGLNGVWFSMVTADFLATVVTVVFLVRLRRRYGY